MYEVFAALMTIISPLVFGSPMTAIGSTEKPNNYEEEFKAESSKLAIYLLIYTIAFCAAIGGVYIAHRCGARQCKTYQASPADTLKYSVQTKSKMPAAVMRCNSVSDISSDDSIPAADQVNKIIDAMTRLDANQRAKASCAANNNADMCICTAGQRPNAHRRRIQQLEAKYSKYTINGKSTRLEPVPPQTIVILDTAIKDAQAKSALAIAKLKELQAQRASVIVKVASTQLSDKIQDTELLCGQSSNGCDISIDTNSIEIQDVIFIPEYLAAANTHSGPYHVASLNRAGTGEPLHPASVISRV